MRLAPITRAPSRKTEVVQSWRGHPSHETLNLRLQRLVSQSVPAEWTTCWAEGNFAKQFQLFLNHSLAERYNARLGKNCCIGDPGVESKLDAHDFSQASGIESLQAAALGGDQPYRSQSVHKPRHK